ncbi:gamma DNA-directed DNA polymerase [Gymnopilus junonius]|uniref:Mitochondrial DNA polymerase catalytic subunit n=1 Tax=Gymnopilus junonius TaxID=109634 RepID=A0A9P5NM38_GYMJU|nr:gamma DNA-directed DNA polymerase [Gymnopilus junonius]
MLTQKSSRRSVHSIAEDSFQAGSEMLSQRHVKRNEVGVQLLSRKLHAQVFKGVSFPAPPRSYVQISREHLEMHGLDPTQTSVLPDTNFQLPPLQGVDLSEHFHRIGARAAQPWLSISKSFASSRLPPKPDHWHIQSGWTKYYHMLDGSSYAEHVETPVHDGKPETMLTFDVETMPNYHPYAIMACAASPNGWYAWISPWLLGESEDPEQLIPLSNSQVPKVIVGHNVAYDRIRILDEYNLVQTANRFIDTLSLHVAAHGISSHQRPAWMKYRKSKQTEKEQREEAVEAVIGLIKTVEERHQQESDANKQEELRRLLQDMEDSLLLLQTQVSPGGDADLSDDDIESKRWEDITSANSLADVAKLHCGIEMDKEIRNDLMTAEPAYIRENLSDYLDYCATDVHVTHEVFSVTLPAFLAACPHPVSFAGILTMGSSFLTVDESWEKYIQSAETVCNDMEEKVQAKLKKLAEDAKNLMDVNKWKTDPWLSQLDWTPKVAGKSRGVILPEENAAALTDLATDTPQAESTMPTWYLRVISDLSSSMKTDNIIPLLLKLSFEGFPLRYDRTEGWHYIVNNNLVPLSIRKGSKTRLILSKATIKLFETGQLSSVDHDLALAVCNGSDDTNLHKQSLLDWTPIIPEYSSDGNILTPSKKSRPKKIKPVKPPPVYWPKWYWEATKPKKGMPPGTLEVTVRSRIAPILLRLSWSGFPLVYSREHGWTFRVPADSKFKTRWKPVSFYDPADNALSEAVLSGGYIFYKVPHKDGEKANVANPLGKSFVKYAQNGTLKSPGDEAKEALDMNSLCSYWISARDRICNQLVTWQTPQRTLGFSSADTNKKYGIILPQMITMGTVTRRAIEKTWLTASNAKKNRVGSELKAMVRAPKGFAIVGADVDSEELWISSCMGDAQFGLHGASAIGWMTLEGTKAAGTDLHSKTASILGISRDQAKVFNYSRIYGAGMRHAVLLLLQSNPAMLPDQAQKLAENLYASTKGKNTHRTDIFDRKFWFGGTESYLFNKLEEIALSDKPQTPALGCGVTYALSKEYLPEGFGSDYMPSRINWVVQSSGVDYLHLLIVSMDHLIAKYDINARYLISVHDELRYLVAEDDKYRAALALQIANLWTRSMFAYKLGMDDLPQGVAFFSAVDIDHVLRKEVDMPCVTPSQPNPIPPGESLDILKVLSKTNGGSLQKNGLPLSKEHEPYEGSLEGYIEPNCLSHRATSAAFLKAQATTDFGEVKGLAQQATGKRFVGSNKKNPQIPRKKRPLGNGEGFDWAEHAERLLRT